MGKKKYSRAESDMAVKLVTGLGIKLIDLKIKAGVYTCDFGENREVISVPRNRIVSVFRWAIAQTDGFKIPIKVNFRYGLASAIGFCLSGAFDNQMFSQLSVIGKAGILMPTLAIGWHDGPRNCYIMFSDLSGTKGIQGLELDGVTVFELLGAPSPERVVMLDSIPM